MNFDFMTPELWNGVVLGVVIIGLALAILRLYSDYSRAALRRRKPDRNTRDDRHSSSKSRTK